MINYLIIINVMGLIICYIDKRKAIKNKYRIPENMLMVISLIGGCLGFFLGMILFRHKIRKSKFYISIPLIIIMWIIILKEIY